METTPQTPDLVARLPRYTQWCAATHKHGMSPHDAGEWVRVADVIAALAAPPAAPPANMDDAAEQFRRGWEAGHAAAVPPADLVALTRVLVDAIKTCDTCTSKTCGCEASAAFHRLADYFDAGGWTPEYIKWALSRAYPAAAPRVPETPQGDQCRGGESMADDYFRHAADCPECSAYEAAQVATIKRGARQSSPLPSESDVLDFVGDGAPTTPETVLQHFSKRAGWHHESWMDFDWRELRRHVMQVLDALESSGRVTATMDTSTRGRMKFLSRPAAPTHPPQETPREDDEPYCRECGATGNRVAYVEAYADSEEWRCKDCGQTFSWKEPKR